MKIRVSRRRGSRQRGSLINGVRRQRREPVPWPLPLVFRLLLFSVDFIVQSLSTSRDGFLPGILAASFLYREKCLACVSSTYFSSPPIWHSVAIHVCSTAVQLLVTSRLRQVGDITRSTTSRGDQNVRSLSSLPAIRGAEM